MTWWMIGLGILWGVLFLPRIALPIMSVMVFDSGKDKTAATKLFAFSMALAPVSLLAGCIGALLFGLGWVSPHGHWGEIFAFLPLANLGLIVIAFVLLEVLQGGSFS
jgi:hypothetical protein